MFGLRRYFFIFCLMFCFQRRKSYISNPNTKRHFFISNLSGAPMIGIASEKHLSAFPDQYHTKDELEKHFLPIEGFDPSISLLMGSNS